MTTNTTFESPSTDSNVREDSSNQKGQRNDSMGEKRKLTLAPLDEDLFRDEDCLGQSDNNVVPDLRSSEQYQQDISSPRWFPRRRSKAYVSDLVKDDLALFHSELAFLLTQDEKDQDDDLDELERQIRFEDSLLLASCASLKM